MSNESTLFLHINSGSHLTRVNKRLENEYENLDVVFFETNETTVGHSVRIWNYLATPLLFFTLGIYRTILRLPRIPVKLGIIRITDKAVANELSRRHDVEIKKVDKDIHKIIAEQRLLWSVAHYLYVFMGILGVRGFVSSDMGNATQQSISTIINGSPILIFTYFIVLGLAFFAAVTTGTIQERNIAILDQIDTYRRENGIDTAVLVTGGAHEDGIKGLLEHFDLIELDNNSE